MIINFALHLGQYVNSEPEITSGGILKLGLFCFCFFFFFFNFFSLVKTKLMYLHTLHKYLTNKATTKD